MFSFLDATHRTTGDLTESGTFRLQTVSSPSRFAPKAKKKKYVCLLFDENLKQGR